MKTCRNARDITDEPASSTQKFSLNGVEWEIDLCDKHADQLQLEIAGWSLVARQKERPNNFRSLDAVRVYTRSNYGTGLTNGLDKKPITAEEEPAVVGPRALPSVSDNWTLSAHAQEQLDDRGPMFGFDRADVFLACVQPEHTADAKGGLTAHFRRNVQLIVDPDRKLVVTVLPGSTRDFEGVETGEMANAYAG